MAFKTRQQSVHLSVRISNSRGVGGATHFTLSISSAEFPRLHKCGLTGRVGYVDSARG
jgi:hypothetical protein